MWDSLLSKPIFKVDQQASEVRMKDERRQLLWRFLFSFGMIAGIVAVATGIAHWMPPIP